MIESTQVIIAELPSLWSWSAGIVALTIVALGIRQEMIANKVRNIEGIVTTMKIMHEHADDYGFGTKRTNNLIDEMQQATVKSTNAIRISSNSIDQLAHFIKVDIETRTGKKLPPPPIEVMKGN